MKISPTPSLQATGAAKGTGVGQFGGSTHSSRPISLETVGWWIGYSSAARRHVTLSKQVSHCRSGLTENILNFPLDRKGRSYYDMLLLPFSTTMMFCVPGDELLTHGFCTVISIGFRYFLPPINCFPQEYPDCILSINKTFSFNTVEGYCLKYSHFSLFQLTRGLRIELGLENGRSLSFLRQLKSVP